MQNQSERGQWGVKVGSPVWEIVQSNRRASWLPEFAGTTGEIVLVSLEEEIIATNEFSRLLMSITLKNYPLPEGSR